MTDNRMRAEPQTLIAPDDEHNRRLVDNVHPLDWVNPEPTSRYHLVVIGAGTAGLVSAAGAAGLGAKAFPSDAAAGWGVLWMITALVVLALSILLQQRLFAAAGLAAIFAYLARLVFDVFESANAALVLVILGLLILGIGMLYQRYSERIFARPQGG